MRDIIEAIRNWADAHSTLLWSLSAASFVFLVAMLAMTVWLVTRLPSDYLTRPPSRRRFADNHHPALRALLLAARNILGGLLILVGLVMLIMPGQGVLTIIAGLILLTFPAKRRLVRRIILRSSVLRTINWLRRKRHRDPLHA